MNNSNIIVSIIIVLAIAAGVTAYGLTNDSNTVFNDLSGFTPGSTGDTGIGNLTNSSGNSGSASSGGSGAGSGSGTGSGSGSGAGSGSGSGTGSGSGSGSSSSGGSSGPTISASQAKSIAASQIEEPGWHIGTVTYNSGGYYVCTVVDGSGTNHGTILVGSGTGRILNSFDYNSATPESDSNSSSSSSSNSNSSSSSNSNSTDD